MLSNTKIMRGTNADIPREVFENGECWCFEMRDDSWFAFCDENASTAYLSLIFNIAKVTNVDFYPSLLNTIRTHDRFSKAHVVGHDEPSPVDDRFLQALLQNPRLWHLSLRSMTVTAHEWNRLKTSSQITHLLLVRVKVSFDSTQAFPLLAPRDGASTLAHAALENMRDSCMRWILHQLPPTLRTFVVDIHNQHQAKDVEKLLARCSALHLVMLRPTTFAPEIQSCILRGLDQTPVRNLNINFAESCFLENGHLQANSPTTTSLRNHFFDRVSSNPSIKHVNLKLEGDMACMDVAKNWFAYRERHVTLLQKRTDVHPAYWPLVLEPILKEDHGFGLVFLLLRNWPSLVPVFRKRVRSQLSDY